MLIRCSLLIATIAMFSYARSSASELFTIQVIDSQTGRGVPLVELSPSGGTRLVTDSNGIVAFDQPALMDKDVFFGLRSYGYSTPSQTLRPSAGNAATVSISRFNRAERLYRVTGAGIYQESVRAGVGAPIDQPLLNAGVIGLDSVQTAIYKDKIHWFWGDTFYENGGFNFRSTGARSDLPNQGGLDPAYGVNLNYFTAPGGNAAQMMPLNETGLVWLDGVFTVRDNSGRQRLLARQERHLNLETTVEQGLALFNDDTETFQRFQNYDLSAKLVPQGHAFQHTVGGDDYTYFTLTYPNVRVKADWDHVTDPSQWEAFTPLKENSRYNTANPPLDLDQHGAPVFGWKKNADPLSYEMLEDLVRNGRVARSELPFRLEDLATGKAVRLHRSSVEWNEYRDAWIMIGVESFGDSFLGEVWFSEAATPEGPWANAVKVATHDRGSSGDYSFYNPSLHPYFDQEGGRFIYFEGTYSNTFSNNPNKTPLYDYNQLMYRLDLAAIPDLFQRVPEPATLAMLVLGLALLTRRSIARGTIPFVVLTALLIPASFAQADIFQWEYVNPAVPALGKKQSPTLCPDGAGVNAVPGATLVDRNLTKAYLMGADLTNAYARGANLTDAELSQANLTNADFGSGDFYGATLTNADLHQANLSNASFTYPFGVFPPFGVLPTDLVGANLSHANLTRARFGGGEECQGEFCWFFEGANLSGADLSGADARHAYFLHARIINTNTQNMIQPDGHIAGLDLRGGASLLVRDYDVFVGADVPIVVDQQLMMDASSALKVVLDADAWGSTISFMPGIPVARGGTLELAFAPNVDLASQLGRAFDLFDWTGVMPSGAFNVASPFVWDVSQLYTTGEVTLMGLGASLAGDFNGNGVVDSADYVVWRDNFGMQSGAMSSSGDGDSDGDVDGADYLVWQRNFGQAIGNSIALGSSFDGTVPEPTAVTLFMGMLAMSIGSRATASRTNRQKDLSGQL